MSLKFTKDLDLWRCLDHQALERDSVYLGSLEKDERSEADGELYITVILKPSEVGQLSDVLAFHDHPDPHVTIETTLSAILRGMLPAYGLTDGRIRRALESALAYLDTLEAEPHA